jgi:hypothetical protein
MALTNEQLTLLLVAVVLSMMARYVRSMHPDNIRWPAAVRSGFGC